MITRHFIDVSSGGNKRRVHYRKAGKGPPLLMVHQSPRSSKEYEALMEKWSPHFTCIAPDTPGFGQSGPLPGNPEIAEYADAAIAFLDALNIEKCAAYGFHSGGIILVTAVKRHPTRITTLAVGGYAIWSAEEMALFSDRYLPEFHPSDYGEHLTWLWNRILEQSWFFPWFATDDAHRLSVANDDPMRVDAIVREMLDAGNAYQAGYGAVLRAPRDIPAVDADVPPCLISAYNGDPLQEHIDRLGDMPPTWSAQKVATPEEHQTVSLNHLLATETAMIDGLPDANDEGFIAVQTGEFNGLIHWRGERGANQLVLHAPSYNVAGNQTTGQIAVDLPGHGLSDNWTDAVPVAWAPWHTLVSDVADVLGTTEIVYPNLQVGEPEQLYPDLSPDRFGNYLNMAWQIVRARHMFAPWYKVDAQHVVAFDEQQLKPEHLAAEHLALINGHSAKEYHIALQSRLKED
ncbi:alpha/beta fold hydrolase [Parasphingorhabdus cellanae]|uniref:Alpha/beta fold hydrolase n=1 Tax=Parasphingorhabdus cellanae TaxID=2806553 RepID=A0ABX7T0R2_9SPHN|nr:alpha/beta hydrolase [Parasphingorhabdus cellanae]QTD55129.1 alpha/beta fold hydrolase [Parasphingorhabdus cellanae]